MAPIFHAWALGLVSVSVALRDPAAMPLPWTRVLEIETPPLSGQDVYIAQNLLQHVVRDLVASSTYDSSTQSAVAELQRRSGLNDSGIFDPPTASALLACCSNDGYVDDGEAPRMSGHKYKVHVQVYANRSIERLARLLDADGREVFNYTVRLHGVDVPANANQWPYFNNSGDGLNQVRLVMCCQESLFPGAASHSVDTVTCSLALTATPPLDSWSST